MKVSVGTHNTGLAKIQLHPSKPLVKAILKGEEGAEPKTYTLKKEDCPEYVQEGVFIADLSANGEKLYSLRPAAGVFKLKVKDFVAAKDKEPAPKSKHSAKGDYTYQTFMVNFIITEGQFKDMVVPGSFSYNFQEGKDEIPGHGMQSVVEISHPKSQFTAKLIEFLEVTGIIKKQMPWKENILPMLQKMILREDKTFSGSVKMGWVDSLYSDMDTVFEE